MVDGIEKVCETNIHFCKRKSNISSQFYSLDIPWFHFSHLYVEGVGTKDRSLPERHMRTHEHIHTHKHMNIYLVVSFHLAVI